MTLQKLYIFVTETYFFFSCIAYNEGVIKKKETIYEKENENRIDNIVLAYDGNASDVPVCMQ